MMKRFFYGNTIEKMTKFFPFKTSKGDTLIECTFREKDGFEYSTIFTQEEWIQAEKELMAMGVEGVEQDLFTMDMSPK